MRYIPYQQPSYGYSGTAYQSVPTIGNIGGQYNPYYGYNNGMYYNQYYNPFYIRQQQEMQRQMELQRQQENMKMWARLIKCRNNWYGDEMSDSQINDLLTQTNQISYTYIQDEQFVNNCHDIITKAQQNFAKEQAEEQKRLEYYKKMAETPIESKPLSQWLAEDAHDRFMQAQYATIRKQTRNTSKLYDTNGYHQLLNAHSNSYAALNQNVTIDDMEIQVNLPQRIKNERDLRRQRFAQALQQQGGY